MLAYHPAKDIYHCLFRLAKISVSMKEATIEIEKLILMDYYTVFPHELKSIALPRGFDYHRRIFKKIKEPYERQGNPKRLIFELRGIQSNAIKILIAKEIFTLEQNKKCITLNWKEIKKIPVNIDLNSKHEWFQAMIEAFEKIELKGPKGLKARSQLMEYRYDV